MKKALSIAYALCFTIALASSAAATLWPNNFSYRVQTMGAVGLAIEDETTMLNLFNHENPAGVALLEKKNRLDLGLGYDSYNTTVDYESGLQDKYDASDFSLLNNPGGEYQGVIYWLDESLVLRGAVQLDMIGLNFSETGGAGDDISEKVSMTGFGGGAGIGYKLDMGLALGAELAYAGYSGKPDDLTGMFNIVADMTGDPDAETSKFDISASNFKWAVGAGYAIDQLGENNKLDLGLSVGSDADKPDFTDLIQSMSINPLDLGDYGLVVDIEGTIPEDPGFPPFIPATPAMDVEATETYTVAPMRIGGEAIFSMGDMVDIGLFFDSKTRTYNYKRESSVDGTAQDTLDYKLGELSQTGISPVLKGTFAMGEDTNLLAGLAFSTIGSGKLDGFSLDPAGDGLTETYKSSTTEMGYSTIMLGVGLQAMEKKLNLGLGYDMTSGADDYTRYDTEGEVIQQADKDGDLVDSIKTENSINTIRVGAEFWVIPMLALRLGYVSITETEKEGYNDGDPDEWVDYKTMTSRLTFGLGMALPEGLKADLMILLDTYTNDPTPDDPETTKSRTGVFAGATLPL